MAETYEYKKEFKLPNSHEWYNISRYLFESFPCQADVIEGEYYKVIEDCAISMGMKYYEDLSDDAYAKIKEWCKEHKE